MALYVCMVGVCFAVTYLSRFRLTPKVWTGAAGEAIELARYTIPSGARVLYCHWQESVASIVDRPATGNGRAYVVDRVRERDGHDAIAALVEDYVRQAAQLGRIPMEVSVVRRTLAYDAAHVRAPRALR
jgi:hypothetical protein